MSEHASPLLFEAISRPQQSLNRTGMRVVAVVLVLGFGLSGLLFTLLGAWPVLGFAGAELAIVLGLFLLHRRWAGRCIERISLSDAGLRIMRIDGRGRAYEAVLEPYWARLRVEEGPAPRLLIGQRGQESEIGLYLNEDEKRDLARALSAALARYREPRFDNPQLRCDLAKRDALTAQARSGRGRRETASMAEACREMASTERRPPPRPCRSRPRWDDGAELDGFVYETK